MTQSEDFAWAIGDFQNGLISGIYFFLEWFFSQNYFNVVVESISACFLEF